jgi:undecaprenyl-diphosphatase
VPLHAAATAVAYSRVHTGVHYPADSVAGSVIGTSAAALVCRTLDRSCGRKDRGSRREIPPNPDPRSRCGRRPHR